MLQTDLKHLMKKTELQELISTEKNVAVVCGRMGPMCIPVYDAMASLEPKYPNVQFRDMEFDNPESMAIRGLPEVQNFMGLPFTVYFKDGKVVKATSSIQSKKQIKEILDQHFVD